MFNLSTKFQVSISSGYKDIFLKGKNVESGWFVVVSGHSRSIKIAHFD